MLQAMVMLLLALNVVTLVLSFRMNGVRSVHDHRHGDAVMSKTDHHQQHNNNNNKNRNINFIPRRELTMLKAGSNSKIKTYPTVIIPSSYNVAGGFVLSSLGLVFLLHNYIFGVIVGLIGLFIGRQTGKVRFVFDSDSMEILISKTTDGSEGETIDNLVKSRDNFAVGGRNRWTYSSFTDWFFIPSRSFPILMYFNENQTNANAGKGQLHLFPVVMDASVLNDLLVERVGPSSRS